MRKTLQAAAWALGSIVALALLLIGALLILGNTGYGRRLIQREVASLTSGKVQLAGLSGTFPSALDVASLQLRDTQGVWMRAEHLTIRWSPLALLHAVLHVEQFHVVTARLLRRPSSTASTPGNRSSRSHLPSIDIDRLAIDTLVLDPAAAGAMASLSLQGDAHYRSLQDARAQLGIRRSHGSGDYRIEFALAPAGMQAQLQLHEPAGGPLEHLANLPGLGALTVNASLDGPRNAERLQLAGQVGALSTEVNGTVNLTDRIADVSFALHAPAMTPEPGLSWKRIALQGRVRGPLATPQASGQLELEGLVLPDGMQLGSVHADAGADGHVLRVQGLAAGILLPPSQPQLLENAPLTLVGTLRLDAAGRPLQLTLTHRLFSLQADAVTQGNRSASFQLQLPDLAPVAALYQQPVRGSLMLSGTMSQSGPLLRAEVNGMGSLAGASPAAQLLGAHTRLHLAATLNGSTLDLQQFTLSGKALSLAAMGSARRTAGTTRGLGLSDLQAQWRVSLPDLALVSPAIAGSLQTTGTAQGSLNALSADVRARSTLSMRGGPPGDFVASLQARGLPSAPSATLHAHGTFDGAPLQLDAAVEHLAHALYRVVIDRASWKSVSAHGDLTAGSNLAASHGELQLRIPRLADLQPLLGTPLAGSLAATVNLVRSSSHPRASFELTARDVNFKGVAANARLSGAGPLKALRIHLTAASPSLGGSPANVSASAQLNGVARALELERFQMRYHGLAVHLASRSSRVTFARGLTVRNLRLTAGQAVIALDGQLSPRLNFRASVHQVDARLVNAVDPGLLTAGTLNADAQLHGSRSAPLGQASVRVAGVKLATAAAQGLPALDATASARLAGSSGDVLMQFKAGATSDMKLNGLIPLNSHGRFAVKLSGQLDLALTNFLLAEQGEHARGILTVAATASGTAREPQITGTVHLAHGDLRDYPRGIHLGNMTAQLVGRQGSLRIENMTAHAGPGQLSMTGTVGVLQPGMPLDISIKGQRIQPIVNDILTANLDTRLHVAGTLRQRLDVTGNVHINHAAVSIPNGFPPSVAVLDVVVPGQKPPPRTKTLVIALDIDVNAPQSIFVQGRGLDAQLGGKLQIMGTSDKPQVGGAFNMIRGAFSLAGTNIKFTSGRVSFNGEGLKDKIDPTLDFLAQASVTYNNIPTVVYLNVTGFADAPKISLSSTPPLPQDDLLALLLFGQPASKLSVLQLAETGAAVASLSGIGGGSGGGGHSLNPLTWIKHALGLNAFSVGGASAPADAAAGGGSTISGASVTAGKYVSNRVYVAATQSTTGTSQVQVDVDLNAGVKLEARLGNGTATAQGTTPQNDPGSSIGLTWQHRY